jgi:hypothetical protein
MKTTQKQRVDPATIYFEGSGDGKQPDDGAKLGDIMEVIAWLTGLAAYMTVFALLVLHAFGR